MKYGKFMFWFPGREQIVPVLDDFDKALKSYRRDNIFFKTDSEDFKKIIKKIEVIEQDIICIHDVNNKTSSLLSSLGALKDELEIEENKEVIKNFYPEIKPFFIAQVAELLSIKDNQKLKRLQVGGALKLKDEADRYTGFIGKWVAMAKETKAYLIWLGRLKLGNPEKPMENKDDKKKLRWADAKLVEATYELMQARHAADLEAFAAVQDLKLVYETLAFLSGKYQIQPWQDVPGTPLLPSLNNRIRSDQTSPEQISAIGLNEILNLKDIFEPFTTITLPKINLTGTAHKLGDYGVLIVSIAAAVVTALQANYINKPFGTFMDYAVILFVGVALQTTVTGLKTLITNLRAPIKS